MEQKFERPVLESGRATFEIKDIELNYISKSSGNSMKRVTLYVTDSGHKRGVCWEYYTEKSLWKWINMLNAISEKDTISPYLSDYERYIGLKGECTIKIEPSTNPSYPDPSVRVDRYLPWKDKKLALKEEVARLQAEHGAEPGFDDEIPF